MAEAIPAPAEAVAAPPGALLTGLAALAIAVGVVALGRSIARRLGFDPARPSGVAVSVVVGVTLCLVLGALADRAAAAFAAGGVLVWAAPPLGAGLALLAAVLLDLDWD